VAVREGKARYAQSTSSAPPGGQRSGRGGSAPDAERGGFFLQHPPGQQEGQFEAALTREPFDLILSDYNLPGYDGVAVLKHAQLVQPDVPVIIISGTVGEKEGVRCLHLGATDYLLKKSLDRLVPTVQRAIQEAETRRTRKQAEAALVDLRDAIDQHAIVAMAIRSVITERKEAELALRHERDRAQRYLDTAEVILLKLDLDGRIALVNRYACSVLGWTAEELRGRDWIETCLPARTLVVEDENALREVARKMLVRLGYTALVAANANEALRRFEQNGSIDVLLTDIVMPGASGPELTRQLAKRYPALRVVYMSGYTEDAIVEHGVLHSGVALLHKPFTSDTLGRKVREALDR
jgi:CheY-like chemotaxis protein